MCNLKQSPRAWFKRFDEVINFGLKRQSCDHFVFYKSTTSMGQILLVVHVDDTTIIADDDKGTHEFKIFL